MTDSDVQSPSSPAVERDRAVRLAAGALCLVGILSAGAATIVDPGTTRQLLVAFAGVGLYGGIALYVLRPGLTETVDPADSVYGAVAATGVALKRDFDLPDRHLYVPTEGIDDGFAPVYLLVGDDTSVAPARRPVVGDGAGGVTLYPTGAALLDAAGAVGVSELPDEPGELGSLLTDLAVAGLELAETVDVSIDPAASTATATVRRPRFGPATRFDHPVASLLAVGFAHGLDRAVSMTVESADRPNTYSVTCRWGDERAA